jgi:hypothetical protein
MLRMGAKCVRKITMEIEAYAVGRLSREELDDRATAAYSAKTRGELCDATADLPLPGTRAGLPSDSVGVPRRGGGRLIAHMILTFFLLVLAARLAGLVPIDVVFEAMVPIPTALVLLLQPPHGISEQCSTRDPRGKVGGRRAGSGGNWVRSH